MTIILGQYFYLEMNPFMLLGLQIRGPQNTIFMGINKI